MAQHDDETLKAMGRLMHKIGMNPKTRPAVVEAIRTIDPNARFPDIEAKETRQYVDQRFEEERQKEETAAQQRALERQRRDIMKEYGNENIEAIEKFMVDNGVPNYQVAAKAWGADNKPAMPNNMPSPFGQPWEQPPDLKELLKDNGKAVSFQRGKQAVDDILKFKQAQRYAH